MSFAVTKMSSKGQIVIPVDMREDIQEGEQLLVIKAGEQIILKKATKMDKKLAEDLEFARRTEAAWKRYEEGKFTRYNSVEEFLESLRKL